MREVDLLRLLLDESGIDIEELEDQQTQFIDNASIYSMDSLLDEVFAPTSFKVPYPDHLIMELQMSFRQNYKFVNALTSGDPNAINYLTGITGYSKSQLDAYTHLFTWLIENEVEFEDSPSVEEYKELEDASTDMQETNGDDNEQSGDEVDNEGEKGDNEQDDNGDTQDSSQMTKSDSPSKNIKESKGEGQVQKEGDGSPSNKGQKKDGEGGQSGGALSPGEQTEASKKGGKSLWDKMKDVLKDMAKPTSPAPKKLDQATEKAKEETSEAIKKREELKKLSDVFKEIEKDLNVTENDDNTDKTESDQDNERHDLVRPGGRDISASKAELIVKDWIEKAAFAGIHMKTAGYDKWDRRKISKYVVTNQTWRIPSAKYSHFPDEIMFMLDFSGSCAWISKTFARLGKAASEFDHVIVAFGGYEGYVQGFIKPDTDLAQAERDLHRRGFSGLSYGESSDNAMDVSLGEYLAKRQSIKTVFILGDYDGTQRYVDAYYRHRHVRFVWFLCERYSNYRGYKELGGLKHHIYYFDGSVEGLASLIHRIKL